MRIASGATDLYIFFVAVDETDGKTRETGYGSAGWTVKRSRNGGSYTTYTTPTVVELGDGNYALLIDEDTTIGSTHDDEEMLLHITHAGMFPVTRVIDLYRPKVTVGQTLAVAGGALSTIAANAVNASALATDAVNEIVAAVWAATTRLLTAGTNIVLAKGVGLTGLNDLSATQVNAEVDAALADYDAPTKAELDAAVAPLATEANLTSGFNTTLSAIADVPNNAEFAAAMEVIDLDFDAIAGLITGLNNPSASAIATAVHNFVVEDTYTFKQTTRLMASSLLGQVAGAETAAPITFKGIDGTTTRITMTGDQYGNRSNPIYNVEDA